MTEETKSNEYNLLPRQKKIAELLANPYDLRSKEEKCRSLRLSKSTLWKWEKTPEFRAYVNDLVAKYTDSAVPNAWRSLIQRMPSDTQAIKLFFELKDMYRDRKELTGKDGGPIQIAAEKLDEEIRKLLEKVRE